MARLLHPSYFPATRMAPNCQYWGGDSSDLDIPLEKKMEAYWRVRKWSINISATFNDGASTTGASGILDVSSRGSEANLVCPGFALKELDPIGEMFSAGISINDGGILLEGLSFDDILLFWPDDRLANLPVTFKIGEYEKLLYASLFTGSPAPLVSSFGLVEAIEWWPYEDANGSALYDTATGEPL